MEPSQRRRGGRWLRIWKECTVEGPHRNLRKERSPVHAISCKASGSTLTSWDLELDFQKLPSELG